MKKILPLIKQRWGLSKTRDIIFVILVFALSGSSVLYVANAVYWLFGFDSNTPLSLKIIIRILVIVPVYQVLLLLYGFIFGQFHFFWTKEKAMGRWLFKRFQAKSGS